MFGRVANHCVCYVRVLKLVVMVYLILLTGGALAQCLM